MRQISSYLNGLVRTISIGKEKKCIEDSDETKVKEMILKASGCVIGHGSKSFVSVYSKRGEKGVNQDCSIVWEGFGSQENTIFCGIFDGHGQWGHYVSKEVRQTLPISLLCNFQEAVKLASSLLDKEKKSQFNLWKQSLIAASETVDKKLEKNRKIDTYFSGTTALTLVKQGDFMIIANVGDSRAILATESDNGNLVPVLLSVDFKPNLPQEAERINQQRGRVFSLPDEPGMHRLWRPDTDSPGLAMSRAFGDFCIKDYGLVSEPDVLYRRVSSHDRFVILATDGVWDVVSNQEAIDVVSSTMEREKSAKRLVEFAVRAWKRKRRGIAVDDCSAICLFFHSCPDESL